VSIDYNKVRMSLKYLDVKDDRTYLDRVPAYSPTAYDNPDKILKNAQKVLKGKDFDTIVGMGHSGALVIPMLAEEFNCMFAMVRKENNSHAKEQLSGNIGRRWIFVDDLVATGMTKNKVRKVVTRTAYLRKFKTEFVGSFLYDQGQRWFDAKDDTCWGNAYCEKAPEYLGLCKDHFPDLRANPGVSSSNPYVWIT